jgi:hypothetical protein
MTSEIMGGHISESSFHFGRWNLGDQTLEIAAKVVQRVEKARKYYMKLSW